MKNIKRAKKIYLSTKIPLQLDKKIEKIINKIEHEEDKKRQRKILLKQINHIALATSVSVCLFFIILLNTNETFAQTVQDIPMIGNVAKILTWVEYNDETDNMQRSVKIPEVVDIENSKFQNDINLKIGENVKQLLNETDNISNQIEKEIGKNSQKGSIYGKLHVRIDYEVKYNSNNILSFILIKEEGLNTSTKEIHTYNYNLETGKELTLKDILGNDYKKIANTQIAKQIKYQEESDENKIYFHKEDQNMIGEDSFFNGIFDYQSFYINEKENPVIIFDKYAIAPGYMGTPEFEIIK